jgi:hypothetical protein
MLYFEVGFIAKYLQAETITNLPYFSLFLIYTEVESLKDS